jgi:hypothetical protein
MLWPSWLTARQIPVAARAVSTPFHGGQVVDEGLVLTGNAHQRRQARPEGPGRGAARSGGSMVEFDVVTERAELSEGAASDVLGTQVPKHVGTGIVIEGSGGKTPIGGDEDLMGNGHYGPLVTASASDLEVALGHVAALETRRATCRLDERVAQPLGSLVRLGRAALAGRLSLTRTHACPRGEVPCGRQDGHVGADLGQDHLGRVSPHPGDALKQDQLGLERGDGGLDPLGDGRDVGFEVVDVGEHALEQKGVVLTEPGGERLLQGGELRPQLAPGELGHRLGVGHAGDEGPHHVASRGAHHVGGDQGELDAGVLQGLVDPIHLRGPLLGEGFAVAGEVAQLADGLGRDEARLQEPSRQEERKPGRVDRVGFAARDVLEVTDVHEHHLEVGFEHVVDGLPGDAGRFHCDIGHSEAAEPVREREQVGRRRAERRHLLGTSSGAVGEPGADEELRLTHVDAGAALDQLI